MLKIDKQYADSNIVCHRYIGDSSQPVVIDVQYVKMSAASNLY